MKAVGDFTVEDSDNRKKQQQLLKNRRSKQNLATLPGGGCSSVNSQQYSEKASDIAFNSLPPIHIGDTEPLMGVVEGAFSRSCPLPNLSSPLEPSTSNGSNLQANPAKRKFFVPHWSAKAVEEAIEKGNAFRATFRVNAHNRQEAYCSLDGVPVDVLINGADAQNRAIEGDTVAIILDPLAYWTKLKGSNVPAKPAVADASFLSPEVGGVGENCASQEQMDADWLLPVDRRYYENGSTSESGHVYLENGSETAYTKSDGHKYMTPEISNAGCFSKQDEASRALARICAMVNSCPSKRPTGRVLAILRNSPRRGAVIGFLAAKEEHRMQNTNNF